MIDLYNQQYTREELKKNIYALKLIDIVKTQKLDYTFVTRYILNRNYQFFKEDENLTVDTVLQYQPHLLKKKLLIYMAIYKKDDDSVEDFDVHL